MDLIRELIQQRLLRNISQKQICDHLGINSTTLSRYETGKRKMNVEIMLKYADYLGFELKLQLK